MVRLGITSSYDKGWESHPAMLRAGHHFQLYFLSIYATKLEVILALLSAVTNTKSDYWPGLGTDLTEGDGQAIIPRFVITDYTHILLTAHIMPPLILLQYLSHPTSLRCTPSF